MTLSFLSVCKTLTRILAFRVLEQVNVFDLVVELLVREGTVLQEDLQLVPFLLKVLAVFLEHRLQLLGHLLADVGGDFLDVGVGLQIGTGDVERDVGRVDDAVQQGHKLGDDALQLVGDKDLVAVELHAVFLEVELVLDFREIEDAGEVEGVVHVEVDLEHRVLEVHRIEFVVELLVVLIGEGGRRLLPERVGVVDDAGHLHGFFLGFLFFLVLVFVRGLFGLGFGFAPFGLGAAEDGDGQETAVLVEQPHDFVLVEELGGVVGHVQHNLAAALRLVNLFQGEIGRAVATPLHGRGVALVRLGEDIDAVGHHKGRVEAEPEMADDVGGVGALVFGQEILGARKSDLVDVFVHLLGRHPDAVVDHADGFVLLVDLYLDGQVAQLAVGLAETDQPLDFLRGVHGVRNKFAKEYLIV